MSLEVATKEDIEEVVDRRTSQLKQDLIEEMRLLTQTKYIGLEECAAEWGVTPRTASSRIKTACRQGHIDDVMWDTKPIRINRRQFYEYLKTRG